MDKICNLHRVENYLKIEENMKPKKIEVQFHVIRD